MTRVPPPCSLARACLVSDLSPAMQSLSDADLDCLGATLAAHARDRPDNPRAVLWPLLSDAVMAERLRRLAIAVRAAPLPAPVTSEAA